MKKGYVALLRGINVGGQKKIKMADLRTLLTQAGLEEVSTYIQSGNLIFKSTIADSGALEDLIAKNILEAYGFEVSVVVLSEKQLKTIVAKNPLLTNVQNDEKNFYYIFLKSPPKKELVTILENETYPHEVFVITNECIYLGCLKGYGNAKCNNNFFEQKLKIAATARNSRTVAKLAAMLAEA